MVDDHGQRGYVIDSGGTEPGGAFIVASGKFASACSGAACLYSRSRLAA
jgi:hypothetical protein